VDWEREAGRLAAGSLAEGSPTAWFDRLYRGAVAGAVSMPWDRDAPSPPLAAWAPERVRAGDRAAVVGCGLGADAEFLARLGADVLAAVFVIDLPDLGGSSKLEGLGVPVRSLVSFPGH